MHILEGLIDVSHLHRDVDDNLLYDFSVKEAFFHAFNFLLLYATNGVTLNPQKFQFPRKELEFLSYQLPWDKYSPSDHTLNAIQEFPMPNNPMISDIQAWHGLIN